ncbi:hypothetical protein [Pseudemcibacter aquimaris]|uniref:hypothetical protein n=1 Tax=Pseudemcibacter aquimaris TaxID=2857064 RepID=UPI0020134F30|nr:hypothetical protein [Pseudemcibacter aquimaris]MCC3859685.1 hypothetical protein [Pseudemcibacter aquimaris]WDU60080.1 hypothetical protein KW060_07390 [Pseudemcibacter aquimaris]
MKLQSEGLKEFLPAAMCLVLSFIFLLIMNFTPNGKTELAVIFPPGTSSETVFLKTIEAGGYATGKGGFENIALFIVDDLDTQKQVIENLYDLGALVVIDGIASAGCFS